MKATIKKFLLISLLLTTNAQAAQTEPLSYSDQVLSYLKQILPKDPVIFEAGGRFGEDTAKMKSVWPNATIYVFEPLPSSYEIMVKQTKHLSNVTCSPYALTTYCGTTNFYVCPPNCGASSISFPVAWADGGFIKAPISVPCTTINIWAQENKISKIDFMWLDMEGHELQALQNASNILESVKAIYTEINLIPIRLNSCLYTDLKKFLEAQGFSKVWAIDDIIKNVQGNALFIKKNLLE